MILGRQYISRNALVDMEKRHLVITHEYTGMHDELLTPYFPVWKCDKKSYVWIIPQI